MDRHERSLLVAGFLSALALGAVFAAVLGVIPADALPQASDGVVGAIPHVNAALSLVALVVIGAGWRWARERDIEKHRAAMGLATLLFATFLALYLYRIVLEGPTEFGGTGALAAAYYAVLGVHILLAVVCVPLVVYALTLAATYDTAELPRTPHPRVGRVAAALWMVSFALGVVVYAMLYL